MSLEKFPPMPLVYPDISGMNQYTNVLLIENSVPEYQQFVNSANASTLPIVYSIYSTKNELLTLLRANFTIIPRIGFCFTSSSGGAKIFLDREVFFIDDQTLYYKDNLQFIMNIITEFQVKNIDYLACDTLNYPNWVNYYAILTSTGVTVGASSDQTGNIKYGGDWVLESTSQDVEFVYFTQSIEYYTYLLDNPSWATINNCDKLAIDTASGYLYVSTPGYNTIVRVPLNNPGGATSWFSSGINNLGDICIYQGYLYVANYGNNNILKINLSDATYSIFADSTKGLSGPRSLAIDGTYLYVIKNSSSISQFLLSDPNTYVASWANSSQGLNNPNRMVISNGYLYVCDIIFNSFPLNDTNVIIRIQINIDGTRGSYNSSWATNTQGLNGNNGLLIYNGYIYASNNSNSTISQISLTYPNSDYNSSWATSSQGLYYPQGGLAIDNTYMYVTSINSISQISLPPSQPPSPPHYFIGNGYMKGTGYIVL